MLRRSRLLDAMAANGVLNLSTWKQPHPVLAAVQHIRRMRGGSQAHLLAASDGNLYITKFQNNPQHIRVLANEFLATRIANFLGLPVSEAKIIAVPENLVEENPRLRIEVEGRIIPCLRGLQLGTRYAADLWQDRVFEDLPKAAFERVINRQDFWRILAFDKWLGNCDARQALFIRRSDGQQYEATFIDHGYCFNAAAWNFPDLPLLGTYHQYYVYSGVEGWESFEPTLSSIESLDCTVLWNLASEIPPEWYQYDYDGLCCLVESLHKRQLSVRSLILQFRQCSHQPFPDWKMKVLLRLANK